ncbi:hypothetical protein SDRG_13465 [Saprolegnia diclina VS20]|uniref:Uncharacterized protein n=1 Tax=Saprolegnia diclina (strain VS20) TaxID=1156394 RepID=T0RGF5_SAPDV|nr:hypothetical protein SDRG_13465 [Saprolegnia diclina VS20]EQC28782.1 hypothetical protein SDRG_13465 [Saprolegnia diclina VS20]|eukprot:XP_008617777.1 hypothetical protein SDRG_13465 [Saprolegnia diclina VS20]
MADDALPASELRTRYGRGGTVRDSELSAGQLRSRYAIEKNTFKDHPASNTNALVAGGALALFLLLGAAAFFLTR